MKPKDAISVKEASAYLAMDERAIARLAEERRIPALKLDGQWLFSRKSLQKWQRMRERATRRA